jgi:hypothetical protein
MGLRLRLRLRLPSFLATLYSRLLLEDPDPSAKWCQSEIKLIYNYKDGDKNDPANFKTYFFN